MQIASGSNLQFAICTLQFSICNSQFRFIRVLFEIIGRPIVNLQKPIFTIVLVLGLCAAASAQGTRLLRQPAVSRDLVAFEYAGDLWVVSREGGQARRLTSTPTVEADPHFSPDGAQIAFTATVGGNTDVYVVPAAGGDPRRLTYHPGLDVVRGWTPDGRRVLFNEAPTT